MSSSSSWYRVATGMRMVAEAAAKSASSDLGRVSLRLSQHAADMVAKAAPRTTASHINANVPAQSVPQPPPLPPPSPTLFPNVKENVMTASQQPRHVQQGNAAPEAVVSPGTDQIRKEVEHSGVGSEGSVPAKQVQSQAAVSQENQILSSEDGALTLLKEGRAVPSTRVGRAVGFAQLGVGLAFGAAVEGVSRVFGSSSAGSGGSIMINDSNSDRLAESLCRMRGAALKMGQMLSIQDESLLPPALSRALQQVRKGAEAMPKRQLLRQLETQLGSDWKQRFESFEEAPFAAASIGQVHRATILDPTTGTEPRRVVVKVQYPGVARSIESDLRNLSMLVTMTGLAPKGLFIENVIRVGQQELKVECDYLRELQNQKRIQQLVESDPVLQRNRFVVPAAFEGHSTNEILTSEYVPGGTIDKVSILDQQERNRIGRTILYLTMKELFEWRFMQTDPNWGNFLYDVGSGATGLIDFGAARDYSKDFVDGYLRIVWASANRDKETLMAQSRRMNFLTGDENEAMLRAHEQSGYTVGEPFWQAGAPFDFRGSNISSRMGEHTAVFLQHRLTPPPEEVYTLHRKLAGAYMLCIKLGAIVECRSMLEEVVRTHTFEDGQPHPME